MIVYSQAPTRLSLFGGGTDLPTYANKYGGICLNIAINVYQNMLLSMNSGKVRKEFSLSNLGVPDGADISFYMTICKDLGFSFDGVILDCEFDGIIHAGMGSSASAAVALIGAINRIKGLGLTRGEIAEKAWDIEVNKLNMYGGRQDQYAATFGGVNVMEFEKDKVTLTPLSPQFIKPLLPSIVLFYTGENRSSPKIQEGFKELTNEQVESLDYLKRMVVEVSRLITEGDIKGVGLLLDQCWEAKKKSNKGVSNETIDKTYREAKKNGAWGGKVMGAGGGGFMFFMVDPLIRDKFIKRMEKEGLQWWDFDICYNGLQTRILPE